MTLIFAANTPWQRSDLLRDALTTAVLSSVKTGRPGDASVIYETDASVISVLFQFYFLYKHKSNKAIKVLVTNVRVAQRTKNDPGAAHVL